MACFNIPDELDISTAILNTCDAAIPTRVDDCDNKKISAIISSDALKPISGLWNTNVFSIPTLEVC